MTAAAEEMRARSVSSFRGGRRAEGESKKHTKDMFE